MPSHPKPSRKLHKHRLNLRLSEESADFLRRYACVQAPRQRTERLFREADQIHGEFRLPAASERCCRHRQRGVGAHFE